MLSFGGSHLNKNKYHRLGIYGIPGPPNLGQSVLLIVIFSRVHDLVDPLYTWPGIFGGGILDLHDVKHFHASTICQNV